MYVSFELSVGDFIDRMTIAEIKLKKIGGEGLKLDYLNRYMPRYHQLCESTGNSKEIDEVYKNLLEINTSLWGIEDQIRNESDPSMVHFLSQEIISLNDRRAFHKRQIDQFFGVVGDPKKYVGVTRNYTI